MKKMKLRTLLYIGIISSIVTSTFSCTKLKEEFKGELEEGTSNVDPGSLLITAYNSLNTPYQLGDAGNSNGRSHGPYTGWRLG